MTQPTPDPSLAPPNAPSANPPPEARPAARPKAPPEAPPEARPEAPRAPAAAPHPAAPPVTASPVTAPPVTAPRVIAIDGPAAAGKGTLARRIAAALGLPYLDTGLLYRATTRRLIDRGLHAPAFGAIDPAAAAHEAASLTPPDLARTDLRTPEIDRLASAVASIPAVRAALLAWQRDFGRTHGGVLDGRDIGTVIFPDAHTKFFVTASVEARAQRRWKELQSRGVDIPLQTVKDDLEARDAADVAREAAPLRPAPGAVLLDTTLLDPDQAFAAAMRAIEGPP
jgi:cytidylate kinase